MEFLINPSIWMGLLTLIVLEIVLGIDNVIFVAMLSSKLPPKERDYARIIGLSLAFTTRLGLLSLVSQTFALTKPLFYLGNYFFSSRDLILFFGGMFLLFKATIELYKRLENKESNSNVGYNHTKFWSIVIQIIVLDAVFSLDSVITAAGIANNMPLMITAIVIAMLIILLASHSLIHFFNRYQTVVVLSFAFLLMIGISMIAEGFGFYIPKSYPYFAISFLIFIKILNQIVRHSFIKASLQNQFTERMHECTSEVIIQWTSGNRAARNRRE